MLAEAERYARQSAVSQWPTPTPHSAGRLQRYERDKSSVRQICSRNRFLSQCYNEPGAPREEAPRRSIHLRRFLMQATATAAALSKARRGLTATPYCTFA